MERNLLKNTALLASVFLLFSGILVYSSDFNSKPFRANSYTKGEQKNPSIASDNKGNFVLTWVSDKQDGELTGIFARLFRRNGTPRGEEFQVNTFWEQLQEWPVVAMAPEGRFVISWESYIIEGKWVGGISARLYDNKGLPLGPEFRVNTYTKSYQGRPAAAMDKNGNFIIVWESSGQDGNGMGIFGQRFDSSGQPQGPEFKVNTYTKDDQNQPAVAVNSEGNFVVVWTSFNQDGDKTGIFAQRFNPDGSPRRKEFQVNTKIQGWQEHPDIAVDGQGNFTICWQSYESADQAYDIFARKYTKNGHPEGPEFKVNTQTDYWQVFPAIDADSEGNTILCWQSQTEEGLFHVYARKFNQDGTSPGPEFRINNRKNHAHELPSLTMQDLDNFIVSWKTYKNDRASWDILARVYRKK